MPKISILVPAYNTAPFISETLDSVLAQTFTDWECIVVNDGSTDSTEEIVKKYVAADSRFKLISRENGGPSAARNAGIDAASGEYILPLDSDDRIGAEYIEMALDVFAKNPSVKLVYCRARFFGESNSAWKLPEYRYERMITTNCIFCSSVFRRADAVEAGCYDESFVKGYEDWDFLLRLLGPQDTVVRLDKELFFYRQHTNSHNSEALSDEKELLQRIASKYPDIYKPYVENIISVMRGCMDWNNHLEKKQKRRRFRGNPILKIISIFAL